MEAQSGGGCERKKKKTLRWGSSRDSAEKGGERRDYDAGPGVREFVGGGGGLFDT